MKRIWVVMMILLWILPLGGCYHRTIDYTENLYGTIVQCSNKDHAAKIKITEALRMGYNSYYKTYPLAYQSAKEPETGVNRSDKFLAGTESKEYSLSQDLYEKWSKKLDDKKTIYQFKTTGNQITEITESGYTLSKPNQVAMEEPYLFELAPYCDSYDQLKLPEGAYLTFEGNAIEYGYNINDTALNIKIASIRGSDLLKCYAVQFSDDQKIPLLYINNGEDSSGFLQINEDGSVHFYNIGGVYTLNQNSVTVNNYIPLAGLRLWDSQVVVGATEENAPDKITLDEMNRYYVYDEYSDYPLDGLVGLGDFTATYVWDGSKLVASDYLTIPNEKYVIMDRDVTISDEQGNSFGTLTKGQHIMLSKYGVKDHCIYFHLFGDDKLYHCKYEKDQTLVTE